MYKKNTNIKYKIILHIWFCNNTKLYTTLYSYMNTLYVTLFVCRGKSKGEKHYIILLHNQQINGLFMINKVNNPLHVDFHLLIIISISLFIVPSQLQCNFHKTENYQ